MLVQNYKASRLDSYATMQLVASLVPYLENYLSLCLSYFHFGQGCVYSGDFASASKKPDYA